MDYIFLCNETKRDNAETREEKVYIFLVLLLNRGFFLLQHCLRLILSLNLTSRPFLIALIYTALDAHIYTTLLGITIIEISNNKIQITAQYTDIR